MRKYFSEDYVIPSPKLNEDQKLFRQNQLKTNKKRSSPKIEVFFRRYSVKTKKKEKVFAVS